jgi:hypothetical protein
MWKHYIGFVLCPILIIISARLSKFAQGDKLFFVTTSREVYLIH